MLNRDRNRRMASFVVLTAGLALAIPAWGMDDGAGSMDPTPAKPAAPAAQPAADKKMSPPAAKGDAPKAADAAQGPSNTELLNDFVHYVLIDRPDLAKSMGQALLDRKIADKDFTRLVDSSAGGKRFTAAVLRGQRRSDLEEVSSKLLSAYEQGKLSTVRNPEAVSSNIKMLGGSLREREYARTRLREAGEYSMPQLFPALLDRTNPALAAEARQVMVEMGRQAVMPLSAALPRLSSSDQETVINVLGDIPYTASLPFLYDVIENTKSEQTKVAASEAVRRIGGAVNQQGSQAERFTNLANEYYSASPALISFPGDTHQPVWKYEPEQGLTFQSVDSKLFPSTMAMKLSEEALKRDAKNSRALSTWLAANFQREINSPAGYENPLYPKDRRDAMYYAVAAGAGASQDVLARALDGNDTPLARRALAALEKTAGGSSMWKGAPGTTRVALLDALRFPSRRVQYDAALALASTGPREAFPGSDQVVRILASAVRDVGAKYALVLAGETERQASMSELLRTQGYTVLTPGTRLDEVRQSIADAPGVDLMILDLPVESTQRAITESLSDSKLRATPILAMTSSAGALELGQRFGRDSRVRIARQGLNPKEITASAAQLVDAVSGGDLKADEAGAYRGRALAALRDLGASANPVLNVADAQGPLVTALGDTKDEAVRVRIAEVLAFAPSKNAQGAVVDAALAAEGAQRVKLLNVAASGAKRVGNMLEESHVSRLIDLAREGASDEATAAASLLGALNLSGGEVVPLIVGGK